MDTPNGVIKRGVPRPLDLDPELRDMKRVRRPIVPRAPLSTSAPSDPASRDDLCGWHLHTQVHMVKKRGSGIDDQIEPAGRRVASAGLVRYSSVLSRRSISLTAAMRESISDLLFAVQSHLGQTARHWGTER